MGSGINSPAAAFLVVVVIATWAAGKTSATTYVVGDSTGWTAPSGGAATYAAFAAQHTFQVGDLLVFNFQTGQSDLAIVSKQNYDGCISTAPISLVKTGPATVNLTSIGEAYFISTLNGRCSQGQKLAVNVTAASNASPVPTISPPMPPSPAPKAAPPTSMSPPPMSPTPAPETSPTAPTTAPTMSPPSPAPAPGPGGAAPVPGPSMAPSPGGAGGMSPGPSMAPSPGGAGGTSGGLAPAPGPGGAPGDMTPPPSAAPAVPTATAALLLIASFVVANFF